MQKKIFKTVIINRNGLGFSNFRKIYNKVGLNTKKSSIDIKFKHQKILNKLYQKISYSQTLKSKIKRSIGFYIKARNYKGVRHLYNFPVRGQRTHTNSKTRKKHEKKTQINHDAKKLEKKEQKVKK